MAPLAFRFVARFFIVFLVLLSPLFSSAPAATAEALDDVFEVKQGQAAGGCDQRRAELSSTQLPESRALVGAALAAIRDYKTSCAARDQLTAFFGVAFQAAQASYAPVNATHFERVESRCKPSPTTLFLFLNSAPIATSNYAFLVSLRQSNAPLTFLNRPPSLAAHRIPSIFFLFAFQRPHGVRASQLSPLGCDILRFYSPFFFFLLSWPRKTKFLLVDNFVSITGGLLIAP